MIEQAPEVSPTQVNKSADSIRSAVTWNGWLGMIVVVFLFFFAQVVGTVLLSLYTGSRGWNETQANNWLSASVYGQFIFILIVESLIIAGIYFFLKFRGTTLKAIGLIRPRWRDLGYGLLAAPVYFVIYFISLIAVSYLFPSFNVSQSQDVGFNNVVGFLPLLLTFISLAVLPPITEEIMMRGMFYSSAKKVMPMLLAAGVTSLLFAAAHLPEGSDGAPLYVAAVDTFVLSAVLIYLREKTGGLWSSITLHMLKNTVAFLALYIFVS